MIDRGAEKDADFWYQKWEKKEIGFHNAEANPLLVEHFPKLNLPAEMRAGYPEHLMQLSHQAPQLLITYEYDQSQIDSPPFAISVEQVRGYYADYYQLNLMKKLMWKAVSEAYYRPKRYGC